MMRKKIKFIVPILIASLYLVASGIQMEGQSVEDNGEGVCFNLYVYNAQPGIVIDYATGESNLAKEYTGNRHELIEQGYNPCRRCKP